MPCEACVPGSASSRLRRWLASWRLPVLVAALAGGLTLPSLGGGWSSDDFLHRAIFLGASRLQGLDPALLPPRPPVMDLFVFVGGDVQRNLHLMDRGVLPWWTLPDLRLAFFRPLATITHWIDYRLWPDSPVAMHAHSVLWIAACAFLVAAFYRRLMGATWTAGLAALLFALDQAHSSPAGWLANRNSVVALAFSLLGLIAHDRWQRQGWRAGAVAGPLLLMASLFSAEIAVSALAYFVAYALFVAPGTWTRRLIGIAPYVAVTVAWRLIYAGLGYGAWGSGIYIDPVSDPRAFIGAALRRGPVLLLGQWTDLILAARLLGAGRKLWLFALLFLAVISVLMIPLMRRDPVARFWASGMVLSALPVCSAVTTDRVLLFIGVGAFGLMAQFLGALFDGSTWLPQPRLWRVAAVLLCVTVVLFHVVLSPVETVVRLSRRAGPLPSLSALTDPGTRAQTIVVLNPLNVVEFLLLPFVAAMDGQTMPGHIRCLSASWTAGLLTRPDARTLVVRPDGGYLANEVDQLFHSPRYPLALGQRIELTGVTIEVTALTKDLRPAEAAFHFGVSLEDPSLRWLRWEDGSLQPWNPPDVGRSVRFSAAGG